MTLIFHAGCLLLEHPGRVLAALHSFLASALQHFLTINNSLQTSHMGDSAGLLCGAFLNIWVSMAISGADS